MRWTLLITASAVVAIAATSWPVEAQTRKRVRQDLDSYQVKRSPTRITVRKARSYLDPGTEVLPMSRNYTDYAIPPNWYPTGAWDAARAWRYPLPDPFYLPGYYR